MISANFVQGGFNVSSMDSTKAVSGSANGAKVSKTDFSSYMDNSADTGKDAIADGSRVPREEISDSGSVSDNKINSILKKGDRDISGGSGDEAVCEDVQENVTYEAAVQLVQQVMEVIKANTGCTDAQLQSAMDNLGIEASQILTGDNLKNVILEINGLKEPSELLVNQEVYQMYTDILKETAVLTEDFANQYGFTLEDTSELTEALEGLLSKEAGNTEVLSGNVDDVHIVKNVETAPKEQVAAEGSEHGNEAAMENSTADEMTPVKTVMAENGTAKADKTPDNVPAEPQKTANEDVSAENGVMAQQKVSKEESNDTWAVSEKAEATDSTETNKTALENLRAVTGRTDEAGAQKTVESVQAKPQNNENPYGNQAKQQQQNMTDFRDNSMEQGRAHGETPKNVHHTDFTTVTGNLFEHIKQTISVMEPSEPQSTGFATRILNQVLDGIKVMSGEDMTSMEMQLYPENLGKLSIHVMAKNGIVTAQIVAQNEAVKEAIESQMFILKENMNNQDIKIEDVEVTVSSHAFEQEMDNGSRDGSDNQQKKKRFISDDDGQSTGISDLKAIKEELLEEAMKEQSGSTVSYTA